MRASAKLHYIHDPLCGWCYAAVPLVQAARDLVEVVAHGGGMMTGERRRLVSDEWRSYVTPYDRRIAQLTGQSFSPAYFDGLLQDHTALLDSGPPTAAVLAAEKMGGRGLDMLIRLQTAHYVEGLRIADMPVLVELGAGIGLARDEFIKCLARTLGATTELHIAESRRLLQHVGGSSFPTFVLERGGRLQRMDSSAYLGKPDAWKTHLSNVLSERKGRRQGNGAMQIAVIGTGKVGGALKKGLERSGHEVRGVEKGQVKDAGAWGQLIIIAVPFAAVKAVVEELGDTAHGKTVVDATNALSPEMRPALGFTTSGAEELQELLPTARVVKAFNTVFAQHMSQGWVAGQQLTMFAAGDNQGAKDEVLELGKDIGFDAIDAGPLSNARQLEALGYFNIQLGYDLGHGTSIGFKLVQ